MATTPMMKQYEEAKRACPDALLLFRMGDFYEMFHDDARTAARVLGLALTSREKGENATAMAGFPHHQLESYLGKIIAAGMRAAVCEQVEDPKLAKGLVRREVTRIVTPGTVIDDALLDPRENNYLAAVAPGDPAGLAWVELSTGRFTAAGFPLRQVPDQLARLGPAELLLAEGSPPPAAELDERMMVTRRPDWAFSHQTAAETLAKHFGTAVLDGFGFTDGERDRQAIRAAGAVLDYLAETQKSSLDHIDRLTPYRVSSTLEIDQSSRRSLEISRTIRDGRREGSLLWVLDRTRTPMGARLLAEWVANPLTGAAAIRGRLDAVEELLGNPSLAAELGDALRRMYDIERLLVRATTGQASPRDLSFLGRTLKSLPAVKAKLAARRGPQGDRSDLPRSGPQGALHTSDLSPLLTELEAAIDLCPELRAALESALADDCPLTSREGGFIRDGFSAELDALRELAHGGKQWIARYQAQETQRTGIPSLKVGFNQVFGYYIEVTNSHRERVPPEYIRKQTIKNAERYITPELKEYEEKVLTADGQAKDMEYKLFQDLREIVAADRRRLQSTAAALAAIDVLAGLAELARARNYCRPEVVEEPVLEIIDGRHPVLEIIEPEGKFVPNDTLAGGYEVARVVDNDPFSRRRNGGESPAGADVPSAAKLNVGESKRPATTVAGGIAACSTPPVAAGGRFTNPDRDHCILLITGPNMAGKSTYIRQVALLTLMAQIGSFVPARRATIGAADRIFARVGASDELTRGQSTFMVEMIETARIINTATPRSLVILDEIGRGTSTYDGISLAWAVVEHLHERIGCRTLFATHYHELTELEQSLPGVKNLNVAVREWEDKVIFLHKIVAGAADKSYGIHVARLAGVPREVIGRAKDVLAQLEEEHLDAAGRSKIAPRSMEPKTTRLQLTLFGPAEHPIIDKLRRLDLDRFAPIEALQRLKQWQETLAEEEGSRGKK